MAPNGVHVQWVHEQLAVHLPDWVPFRQVIWQTEHTKKWQAQVDVVLGYNDGLRIVAMNHESIITKNGTQFAMRVLNSGKCFWVFDESNAYAKFSASRTKVALKLRDNATCRSILTGTPVGLGIEDLYTQLALLHPDILGFDSFYTFRNHFCEVEQVYGAPAGVKEITGYKNVNELQKKLHAHCIRKTAAECLDLPERTYSTRNVEMTAQQRKAYNDMLDDMLTELDNGAIVTAEQAIVRLMRLQQIVSGFIRDDEGVIHDIPNNRVQAAVDWAGQCNSKMVIWARFHRDIDNLRAAFAKMKPAWWDGRNTSTRAEEKQRFIEDPGCRVFIANQGAAGTGVDGLQYVSHEMLYYSNSFKAIERWQSEARLYRMGQAGTVSVTDLVARNTTDLKLRAVLKKRKATADMVLDTPISEILDPHGINAKEEVFNFIRDLAREDTVDDFLAAK
jgi:SNF2 family DNA or RNA helicase